MTVNRPQVLNALNMPTWKDLRTAFEDARNDATVRGVILTGAGNRAFIAGADINELARAKGFEAEQASRFGQGVLDLIARAEAILKKIASNAPIAIKFAIEATNKGMETSQSEGLLLEASYFGLCAATEDKQEGTSAFLEKRSPRFQGR
jgi:enoyl-CoA hydratase/carnithine racemase